MSGRVAVYGGAHINQICYGSRRHHRASAVGQIGGGGSVRVLRDSCSHSALLSTADPNACRSGLGCSAVTRQKLWTARFCTARYGFPQQASSNFSSDIFPESGSSDWRSSWRARSVSASRGTGGYELGRDHAPWDRLTAPQFPGPGRGLDDYAEPAAANIPAVNTDIDPVSSSRHSRHMSSGCTMPATAARWGRTPASRRAAIRTSAGVRTLTTTAWARAGLDDHRGGPSARWAALEPAARPAGAAVPAAGAGNLVYGPGYRPRVIAKAVGDRGGVGTMGRPGPAPLPREAGCVQGLRGARPGRLNGGS
jgi:hypothetical protein